MTTTSALRRAESIALRALLALAVSLPLLARSDAAFAGGRLARVRQLVRPGHASTPTPSRSSASLSRLGRDQTVVVAKPRATTRLKERLRRLPRRTKIIAGTATVAVLFSAIAGGFWVHGQNKNREWLQSPSHAVVLEIEGAVADRDVTALDRLGDGARVKLAELERQLASARASGADELANGMSIGEAEREIDFAGLAIARADLEEVLLSQDVVERVGAHTLSSWTSQVAGAESSARARGFEGDLALQLKALRGEITAQDNEVTRMTRAIDEFGGRVPRLFADEMRSDLSEARASLTRFRDGEVASERALHERANSAMRGRVSDRLASESSEFAGHRDRMTRLSSLQDDLSRPASRLAKQIDEDLGSVISHRNAEQSYLAIAATKTSVPVTKYRTACCRTETGADGKPRQVSYQEPYIVYEDQSGTWRALAASEASAAQSAARSAQRGLDQLRPMIVKLRNHPTTHSESLIALLPEGANASIDQGHGALQDWFLPPLFNLFSNAGGRASEARAEFRPVLTSLARVDSTVGERRGAERGWVEARITTDLDGQMAQAAAGQSPPG